MLGLTVRTAIVNIDLYLSYKSIIYDMVASILQAEQARASMVKRQTQLQLIYI